MTIPVIFIHLFPTICPAACVTEYQHHLLNKPIHSLHCQAKHSALSGKTFCTFRQKQPWTWTLYVAGAFSHTETSCTNTLHFRMSSSSSSPLTWSAPVNMLEQICPVAQNMHCKRKNSEPFEMVSFDPAAHPLLHCGTALCNNTAKYWRTVELCATVLLVLHVWQWRQLHYKDKCHCLTSWPQERSVCVLESEIAGRYMCVSQCICIWVTLCL